MKKKQNLIGDSCYSATYDVDNVDYYQEFRNTGEIIEVFQQYKSDKHIICNPPRHKEIDEILLLLKKTGIKKITVIR
jgi:hypothetical protein